MGEGTFIKRSWQLSTWWRDKSGSCKHLQSDACHGLLEDIDLSQRYICNYVALLLGGKNGERCKTQASAWGFACTHVDNICERGFMGLRSIEFRSWEFCYGETEPGVKSSQWDAQYLGIFHIKVWTELHVANEMWVYKQITTLHAWFHWQTLVCKQLSRA